MIVKYVVVDSKSATKEEIDNASRLDDLMGNNNSLSFYQKLMQYKPTKWVFAVGFDGKNTQLVGKADIIIHSTAYSNANIKKAKISNLCVLPIASNQNIGTELLNNAVAECDKNKCDYAYLSCLKKDGTQGSRNLEDFYLKNKFLILESNNNMVSNFIKPLSKLPIEYIFNDYNMMLKTPKR